METVAFAVVFGQVLARVRQDRNLSQVELARAVGINQSSLSRYEAGTLDLPLATLRCLAGTLGALPEVLMERATRTLKHVQTAAEAVAGAPQDWTALLKTDLRGLTSFIISLTWEPL
jgi:transcriptional regulator with XRE-family HTH domain